MECRGLNSIVSASPPRGVGREKDRTSTRSLDPGAITHRINRILYSEDGVWRMELDWSGIDHVTKVDPAKPLPADLDVLERTDLVMVGGSDEVTEANTLEVIDRIKDAVPNTPVFQEPYESGQVSMDTVEAADYLSIPAIYNGDRDHFLGKHLNLFTEMGSKPDELLGAALPVVGKLVKSKGLEVVSRVTDKIVAEGYVIQNPNSKAARVSGVTDPMSTQEVAGAALATEVYYDFPVFYIEYSGTYGGPNDVEAAATYLGSSILLYGGGIDDGEKASEILDAGADAVVVGDCFHRDPETFLDTIPE